MVKVMTILRWNDYERFYNKYLHVFETIIPIFKSLILYENVPKKKERERPSIDNCNDG